MNLLALEFSSTHRSVAVATTDATGLVRVLATESEIGGRSISALGMVQRALRVAQLEREQIDHLAVALGPGSNMGVRISISLAQGWQLALGTPVLGVNSADCLAAQAHCAGWLGRVAVVVDAQRHEIYLGLYDLDTAGWRVAEPLRIVPIDEAAALDSRVDHWIGPEATKWFPRGRVLHAAAATVATLAAGRTDFTPAAQLEPVYLRAVEFVKAPPPRVLPTEP
ncbi:tRNA (adenosine(37)-N6)-threonylcarbamoyltransferase complex dimerization subunit type 1 TsaB [Verrucomicrobiota bacterium]|nr:tRNA (adenosine(37)-N6)-threonylcarbamoyltransferase complex dimerization subunit type 1 TsaB [Verrucomicrobiota bacterium]